MRPPLSLPLAPPGDAPSAFVIFVLKTQKFKLNKRRRKSLPSLVERFLRVTPFPTSNLLLCVFGCPRVGGAPTGHAPVGFFGNAAIRPSSGAKPEELSDRLCRRSRSTLARFQTPITITVRQHRTYSYAIFFVGTNERGGRTHTPHANPPQREASSTETKGPRRGSVATISRVAPAKLACEAAGAPTQSAN